MGEEQLAAENRVDLEDTIVNGGGSNISQLIETLLRLWLEGV